MIGKFITIEGTDGSGKTTFINKAVNYLEQKGYKVIVTREPGGVELSEKIRTLLFENSMTARTESLLFAAARSEHVEKKIKPYIEEGYIVISDRFVDSSISYQAYGRGLKQEDIVEINDYATAGFKPDLTLYFSVDVEIGLERTKTRDDNNRMDSEKLSFYYKVKEGFEQLALENKDRIKVIDANKPYEQVEKDALNVLEEFLKLC